MGSISYVSNGPFFDLGADGNYINLGATDSGGTLTDDGGDNFFTVGEDIFNGGETAIGTYLGYINGANGPIFFVDIGGPIAAFGTNDAAVDFPASVTIASLNQDPVTACFLRDTNIASPTGEIAVQDLKIGDTILNAAGSAVVVKWVGRQSVFPQFHPAERLMPVRFDASSLGPNVPCTDLTVSADHAMLIDGVLCHASALVNNTTITCVPLTEMGEKFTLYHVETENHEIILANGAPAETFIDNVSRRVFDNFTEFETLYGNVPAMTELPLPRAMSTRQLPSAIRARLAALKAA